MEVLKFLEQIPLPILVVALVILVAITIVMAYQYAKMRGMDGILQPQLSLPKLRLRPSARVNGRNAG